MEQKRLLGESTPPEYTREDGEPYECPVSEEIYALIMRPWFLSSVLQHTPDPDGIWSWALAKEKLVLDPKAEPWPGGPDGWKSENPPRLDIGVS